MKSFFASFFGTLAALAVLVGAVAMGLAVLASGFTAQREAKVSVESGSWLVMDLADQIQDTPLQNEGFEDLAEALGDRKERVLQARKVTRALEAAAGDGDIAGLYISGQDPSLARSSGYGALKEIRDAILAFRNAGKPVKAWLTYAGTREYYLASAADELSMDPYGAILMPGLATQPMFFTGAFEKFGIGVQVTRVGKYKSAIEPYTRKDMSPESRAQTQKLLDDLWGEITNAVESSRKLPAGRVQEAVDSEGLLRPEQAREAQLVDRIAYVDEVLDDLREATGRKGSKGSFKQIALADYAALVPDTNLVAKRRNPAVVVAMPSGHERIAIVYAEGAIVDGSGSDKDVVWADDLARELRELRRDDRVKAVVLRVNSPGGSVSASEAIQREVRLIQEKKPVVVSMGSVAASGGYWISTYSERIFAEPSTITGSIGVFSLLFNIQDLANEKLGLNFETVKTGRFADAATITRPKTDEELAIIQKSVDWIYDQFLSKVAESRRLNPQVVAEIAQGRVWSGAEAARLGLVDELGGLDAAIAFAAAKASVGEEFTVIEVPKRRKFIETLAEAFDKKREEKAGAGIANALVREALRGLATVAEFNDPRGLYARLPFDAALP
ncbi:MAG: signal peptide peptidase SppA [Candidatus Binatia bacterium]